MILIKNQRIIHNFFCFVIVGFVAHSLLHAASLDGTSSIVYQNAHYVFRNGDIAKGFVRLNGGFTVLPGARATLDLVTSVSGSIDLRSSGNLQLVKDLELDSGVTLSNGGYLSGRGNTLILNNKLTIPASSVLHISSDTMIEGNGNVLALDSHAQLFVDNDVTLTLKNIIVENTRNGISDPMIYLSSNRSNLSLSNVIVHMHNDFPILQGKMFIHGDVLFSGTSSFIYYSTQPLRITSKSVLGFDIGTTFSFVPTTTQDHVFVMEDESSMLHLNGCNLSLSTTGMRITKGRVLLDNKVTINTNGGTLLSTLSTLTSQDYGTATYAMRWSPDGNYLAVGGTGAAAVGGFANTNELRVYHFNGSSLTAIASQDYNGTFSTQGLTTIRWTPDGQYLSIGGFQPSGAGGFANNHEFRIYSFDGVSLTPLISQDYGTADGTIVDAIGWTLDGNYVAIGGTLPASGAGGFANTNDIRVYSFNGSTLTAVTSQDYSSGSGGVTALEWHPNGTIVAVGGLLPTSGVGGFANTNELRLYSFNGSTLTPLTSQDYGSRIMALSWSPDGNVLAIGGFTPVSGAGGFANTNEVRLYSFNGSSLSPLTSIDYGTGVSFVAWHPSGSYLLVGGQGAASGGGFTNTDEIRMYSFNGSSLTPVTSKKYGTSVEDMGWVPSGNTFAVVGQGPTNGAGGFNNSNEIRLYSLNFTSTVGSQASTKGLIFGDSSQGATYNVNVEILGGAHVTIKGIVNDDSV